MVGETYTEITLKNAGDVFNARRRLIKKAEVRQLTVQAMADTGSTDLIINEKMRKQLGLKIEYTDEIERADNRMATCQYTEPVLVYWKDRRTVCSAAVMPGNGEPLLGVLPLEGMDLFVDPIDRQLVGKHGDKAVFKAVSVRRR
jgi:clan AA aspartic protease